MAARKRAKKDETPTEKTVAQYLQDASNSLTEAWRRMEALDVGMFDQAQDATAEPVERTTYKGLVLFEEKLESGRKVVDKLAKTASSAPWRDDKPRQSKFGTYTDIGDDSPTEDESAPINVTPRPNAVLDTNGQELLALTDSNGHDDGHEDEAGESGDGDEIELHISQRSDGHYWHTGEEPPILHGPFDTEAQALADAQSPTETEAGTWQALDDIDSETAEATA